MSVEHIPVTSSNNVDALTDAVDDACEFLDRERVQNSLVYERYNVLADQREDARKLDHELFSDLLSHANEKGDVDVSLFGIAPSE